MFKIFVINTNFVELAIINDSFLEMKTVMYLCEFNTIMYYCTMTGLVYLKTSLAYVNKYSADTPFSRR